VADPAGTVDPDPGVEAWASIAELFLSSENTDRFHRACQTVDLPPPALKALLSLDQDAALSMRTLASSWHCDASWVTSLVDILEERGLVERRVPATDRRVKTVVLTDKGVATKADALGVLRIAPPAMAALSFDERRQLRDLLAKLVAAHRAGTRS